MAPYITSWLDNNKKIFERGAYSSPVFHSVIYFMSYVQESAAILTHCNVQSLHVSYNDFPCVCVCISLSPCICLHCCLLCVWGLGCSSNASNDILLSHSCHSRSGFPLVCTNGSAQCGHWPGPCIPHPLPTHTHTHTHARPQEASC